MKSARRRLRTSPPARRWINPLASASRKSQTNWRAGFENGKRVCPRRLLVRVASTLALVRRRPALTRWIAWHEPIATRIVRIGNALEIRNFDHVAQYDQQVAQSLLELAARVRRERVASDTRETFKNPRDRIDQAAVKTGLARA